MYKLYWDTRTGAFAPEAILVLAGASYEAVRIDHRKGDNRKPEFLAINPMGQLPVLLLPDGTLMTESLAIVLYLVGAHPHPDLAPKPGTRESAIFHRWIAFVAVNAYMADLRASYPDRYSLDSNGADGVQRAANRDLDRCWGIVENALRPGPYLLGERMSAADVYAAMVAKWYPSLAEKPQLSRMVELVGRHPGIRPVWDRYFPDA